MNREAMKQPEALWGEVAADNAGPVYAAPPKRKPLADDEFISMLDSAGLVVDPELAFEIKEMVEAAHGITGEEK